MEPDISHITVLPGTHARQIKKVKKLTPEKQNFNDFQTLQDRNEHYRSEVERIKQIFHV